MEVIRINLKENSYNVYVGFNIANLEPYLNKLNIGNFAFIITSKKIYSLYKNIIKNIYKDYKVFKVIDREEAKSKEWLFSAINTLLKYDKYNKKIFVICFGGGTISDLGGFLASIYKRGIPYINIPTTLLAQIDASIGGKTAINLKEAKNILGTFYQPRAIFIDPVFLNKLPEEELKNGLAEAIKYGIIKNKELFYFLKDNYKKIISLDRDSILKILKESIKIKANIVSKDPNEKLGLRTILNFGHTFAHALETYSSYKSISHGKAVAIGMLYASYLSFILGKCSFSEVIKVKNILDIYSFKTDIDFDYIKLYKIFNYDKKFIKGNIRMVLLKRIGEVEVISNIPKEKVLEALKNFNKISF